jgi:peptidoglycan hydrolase-like protein with peptidoglycan-binding domain
MQRLTRSGTALHAGVLPGYPASHGCIRLPFSFAPKLFDMTEVGGNVVVANRKIKPILIEHANLFQSNGTHTIALASNLAGAAQDVAYPLDSFSYGDAIESATYLETGKPEESGTPLRILVTKQTERDKIIAVQNVLAAMGYLEQQRFTGKLGKATVAAIKAFQKATGIAQTGIFTDDLAKQIYSTANLHEPPAGRLFVRQEFQKVFDVPVEIIDPDKPLGTHVFVATQGDGTELQWVAFSVEGDESAKALSRLVISPSTRNAIEQKLRFGSALIISDVAIDSAILPEGDDFLVLGRNSGVTKIQKARPVASANSVRKIKKATHAASKRRRHTAKTRSSRQPYSFSPGFGRGFFSRW